MRKLRVAAFYPHPDDMEAQVAGTLLKYVAQGHDVHVVIAMDGRRGRGTLPDSVTWPEIVELRKNEAIAGAKYLGVTPTFLGIEDHRLLEDKDCYETIITEMENLNPDLIFTCSPNDYHNDHRALARLMINVSWTPVFFSDTKAGVDFNPDFYVDITEQMSTKIQMLKHHSSQLKEDSVDTVVALNRLRGIQCGTSAIVYAEAFKLHKRASWVKAYEMLPVDNYEPPVQIVPTTEKN